MLGRHCLHVDTKLLYSFGDIRVVSIFANFAIKKNSRIQENYYFNSAILKKNKNSRILNFVNIWSRENYDMSDRWYTDFSPMHSQFAPLFSETFRPQLILRKYFRPRPIHRKDVSPPPPLCSYLKKTFRTLTILFSERRLAPKPYFWKTFRTKTIFQKDVSHPFNNWEWRFAHSVYLRKTIRP